MIPDFILFFKIPGAIKSEGSQTAKTSEVKNELLKWLTFLTSGSGGLPQPCLAALSPSQALRGELLHQGTEKVHHQKAGRQAAGETAAKLSPGPVEPLAGQRWALWGAERFTLAGHQAWPKAVCLPVSSSMWGCRKWNLIQSDKKEVKLPHVVITYQ